MIKIRILGITDGTHDSGACILENDKIISAINEERLSRVKLDGGFPHKSIKRILNLEETSPDDINLIAVGGILTPSIFFRAFRKIQKKFLSKNVNLFNYPKTLRSYIWDIAQNRLRISDPFSIKGKFERIFLKTIFRKNLVYPLNKKYLIFVDHHFAHTASAYFTSKRDDVLCITADGFGDGVSLTVNRCNLGKIQRIHSSADVFNSYAYFYATITGVLGFKPLRDEGKVTGLSTYGDPTKIPIKFPFDRGGKYACKRCLWANKYLQKHLSNYKREDVAAWLQKNIERHICKIIKKWVDKTGIHDVTLAGGLFANVKLNQKIHELPDVHSVYIFPHMGDGGLAVGAALYAWSQKMLNQEKIPNHNGLETIYLGPEYSNEEIKEQLKREKLEYEYYDGNIEGTVAELLSKGKTIARFNGRMEYGPRALGNRSILYQATDATVKKWLNEKLKREKFMPFAPSTLEEHGDKCYENLKGAEYTAKFMTITFDCTDWMKENCPGAVHVDGTARPQLVSKEDNPSFYRVIEEYRKITGLPTIINTSFNIHGEPIVCSPEDAIRTFRKAKLDYLAIGNYLVSK